jgi:hypothetical protein
MKRTSKAVAVPAMQVKKVTASQLRGRLRDRLREVTDNKVLLVQNRRPWSIKNGSTLWPANANLC